MTLVKRLCSLLFAACVASVAFMTTTVYMSSVSYEAPRAATLKITTSDSEGNGSGVMIAPGIMLTAGHVADIPNLIVNGHPARVISKDLVHDIAILSVQALCPCIPLAKWSPLPDSLVTIVGYPLGLPQVATEGRWQLTIPGQVRSVSTAQAVWGNSGGGLYTFNWLKARWELIGIVVEMSGGGDEFQRYPVFHLTRSVPIEYIRYFIHQEIPIDPLYVE